MENGKQMETQQRCWHVCEIQILKMHKQIYGQKHFERQLIKHIYAENHC